MSLHSTPPVVHPFRGVLLALCALLFLSSMDTTTKYLVASHSVLAVIAIRYIVNCVLMAAVLGPSQGMRLVQTHRTGLVLLRALCLCAASLCVGLALRHLPVAEMTAIVFVSPLLVVLVARPILGERIGALGWTAALTGFAGMLLIVRPGSGLDPGGVAFALCAAFLLTAYQLLSRVLIATERTVAMLFHAALVGAIAFGVTLPWAWEGPMPSPLESLLFLAIGVLSWLGHYFFTAAFRHAQASLLAPVNYVQLLWAGLLGWAVFGHVPDGTTIAGMVVVALSGLMIALKARRSGS